MKNIKRLVTIGITCYREGELLHECWNSVTAQSNDNWKAVMVLDGGHDELTEQIFDSIEHPRLVKLKQPKNMGPYNCRNRAFELTQTPYHFYLDADDMLAENTIDICNKILSEKHVDFLYGDYAIIDCCDKFWRLPHHEHWNSFNDWRSCSGPNCYSVKIWKELGGFCVDSILKNGTADLDFIIGLLEHHGIKFYTNCVLYHYRLPHSESVSQKSRKLLIKKFKKIVERHPKFFSEYLEVKQDMFARAYADIAEDSAAQGQRWRSRILAKHALKNGVKKSFGIYYFGFFGTPLPSIYYKFRNFIKKKLN